MSYTVPDQLYKYLPVAACEEVLSTMSLRWSAADCFADPFEMGSKDRTPFDDKTLLEATTRMASAMIFAPEHPKGDSPLINAIRRWRDETRFSEPAEAAPVLRDLLGKMVASRVDHIQAATRQWQDYSRNLRICCFSAKPDSLQAWRNYADRHRGVVLRFTTSTEPFNTVKPVSYGNAAPQLTDSREQLGAIIHGRKDEMISRFDKHNLTKAPEYKNEQEWRCFKTAKQKVTADQTDSNQWREPVSFEPSSLSAVLFGVACSAKDRQNIMQMARTIAPKTRFYMGKQSSTEFSIAFSKIDS